MSFTALTSLVLSQQHRFEEFPDGLPWLLVERVAELTRSSYGPRAVQAVLPDGRYFGDDHCTQNMSISIESNDLHEIVMKYSIGTLIRLYHNTYVIVGYYTTRAKYFYPMNNRLMVNSSMPPLPAVMNVQTANVDHLPHS